MGETGSGVVDQEEAFYGRHLVFGGRRREFEGREESGRRQKE